MKETKFNVYATNKIGKIVSPKGKPKDEPKAKKIVAKDDLRTRRG